MSTLNAANNISNVSKYKIISKEEYKKIRHNENIKYLNTIRHKDKVLLIYNFSVVCYGRDYIEVFPELYYKHGVSLILNYKTNTKKKKHIITLKDVHDVYLNKSPYLKINNLENLVEYLENN